jgi:polar amino acid transport system substrate-binding protein
MKVLTIELIFFLLFLNSCVKERNESKRDSKESRELTASSRISEKISDYTFLTEEFAPYTFKKNDLVVGFSADILLKVFEKIGVKKDRKDFKIYPWARAYAILQNKPNVCLFGTTRTAERENLFKWFGPIYKAEFGLLGKKSKNFSIKNLKDLEKYKIGTTIDFAPEQLLIKAGFPVNKLKRIPFHNENIKKLMSGRVDLISVNTISSKYILKKEGEDLSNYKVYWVLKKAYHYYACHKSTPDEVIQKLQEGLDKIKEVGEIEQMVSKYL